MATHSTILAWRIPWTEEPGGLQSAGSQSQTRLSYLTFFFLHFNYCSLKIFVNGDCSHEIKRCLLLGRKVMTNLDSIFKSRDITLLTKIHLVKAMVFPVFMYGCESWTHNSQRRLSDKELLLSNCGAGEDS